MLVLMIFTVAVPVSADYYEDYYYYEDYGEDSGIGFGTVAISAIVGFGISFAIVSVQKSAMRSVHSERSAKRYINSGSLNLTDRTDVYIRTSVTKVAKKKD